MALSIYLRVSPTAPYGAQQSSHYLPKSAIWRSAVQSLSPQERRMALKGDSPDWQWFHVKPAVIGCILNSQPIR